MGGTCWMIENANGGLQSFSSGNFNLKDSPRSGRPKSLDQEAIKDAVEVNPKLTSRELAQLFNTTHTTIISYLHVLGKISKLGQWVPHELNDAQRSQSSKTPKEDYALFMVGHERINSLRVIIPQPNNYNCKIFFAAWGSENCSVNKNTSTTQQKRCCASAWQC